MDKWTYTVIAEEDGQELRGIFKNGKLVATSLYKGARAE